MRIVSPHDGAVRELYAPLPADLRSPLERLRAIRGFTPESLPAAVTATGGSHQSAASEDVLAVPGARGRLGGGRPSRPLGRTGERSGAPRPSGNRSGDRRPSRPSKRGPSR
jgi:hypothetical protein